MNFINGIISSSSCSRSVSILFVFKLIVNILLVNTLFIIKIKLMFYPVLDLQNIVN